MKLAKLFTDAWQIFLRKIWGFAIIQLVLAAAAAIVVLTVFGGSVLNFAFFNVSLWQIGSAGLLLIAILIFLTVWGEAATFEYALSDGTLGAAVKKGLNKWFGYFLLFLALGIIIVLGLILFIIPGIVLATYLLAAPAVLAKENKVSLGRSFAIVGPVFWPVLFWLFVSVVVFSIVDFVPVVGDIASILFPSWIACLAAAVYFHSRKKLQETK